MVFQAISTTPHELRVLLKTIRVGIFLRNLLDCHETAHAPNSWMQ
jgi:hypothetical protein